MKQFILAIIFVYGVSLYASQEEIQLITKNWITGIENVLDEVENRSFFYELAKNSVNDRLDLFKRLQDEKETVDFCEEMINFSFSLYKHTEKAEKEIKNYVSQTRETCYELIKEKQYKTRVADKEFLRYLYHNLNTIHLDFLQEVHSAYLEYLNTGRDGSFVQEYFKE